MQPVVGRARCSGAQFIVVYRRQAGFLERAQCREEIAMFTSPGAQYRGLVRVQPARLRILGRDRRRLLRTHQMFPELARGIRRDPVDRELGREQSQHLQLLGCQRHQTEHQGTARIACVQRQLALIRTPSPHLRGIGGERMFARMAGETLKERTPEPRLPRLVRTERDARGRRCATRVDPLARRPAVEPVAPPTEQALVQMREARRDAHAFATVGRFDAGSQRIERRLRGQSGKRIQQGPACGGRIEGRYRCSPPDSASDHAPDETRGQLEAEIGRHAATAREPLRHRSRYPELIGDHDRRREGVGPSAREALDGKRQRARRVRFELDAQHRWTRVPGRTSLAGAPGHAAGSGAAQPQPLTAARIANPRARLIITSSRTRSSAAPATG